MSIKNFIKHFFGRIRCLKAKITYRGRVYIGKQCNILGGKKINLGSNVTIRPYVDLWAGGNGIAIGDGSEIGERCRISIVNKLDIGEKVLISPDVYITDCDHAYENVDLPVIEQGVIKKDNRVSIGEHSYIGIHSVIVGNVSIGKHCVIGANSVVTKDIPDYCVAAGSPARIIKRYDFIEKEWVKVY